MAHQDIRDARQLITEIGFPTERPRWAWWTPGDATRYHVTLINAAPSASATGIATNGTFQALVITIDLFGTQPTSIVIPRPADDDERYAADEWVHRNYPGGWWPGIRPLLAAPGWTLTSDRDTTYRSTDHHDIATAEREQNLGRSPRSALLPASPGLAADKAHQPAELTRPDRPRGLGSVCRACHMENSMNNSHEINPRTVADMANRAATFEPMTDEDERTTITVAGVHVALYVDPATNQVCVSVDLDDTELWLLRSDKDSTVPLRIYVQGDVTFEG